MDSKEPTSLLELLDSMTTEEVHALRSEVLRLTDAARHAAFERVKAKREDAWKARRDRIAELYRSGMPTRQIAAEVGLTPGSLARVLHRLRHHYGYDLPYRHRYRYDLRET